MIDPPATGWRPTGWRLLKCLLQIALLLAVGLLLGTAYREAAMWFTIGPSDPGQRDPVRWSWISWKVQAGALIFDAFLLACVYRLWSQVRTEFRFNKLIGGCLAVVVTVATLYAAALGFAAFLFAPEGAIGRY